MSDTWVTGSNRLANQVGLDKADEIARALKNGEVEKILSRVDEFGNVITKKLDSSGNIIGNWP